MSSIRLGAGGPEEQMLQKENQVENILRKICLEQVIEYPRWGRKRYKDITVRAKRTFEYVGLS